MSETRMPFSTVTVANNGQNSKHPVPIRVTDDGRKIDVNDEQYENARSPMIESLLPGSNVTF
jgi:hypothetical protein